VTDLEEPPSVLALASLLVGAVVVTVVVAALVWAERRRSRAMCGR
jgi:hypothetical protein